MVHKGYMLYVGCAVRTNQLNIAVRTAHPTITHVVITFPVLFNTLMVM